MTNHQEIGTSRRDRMHAAGALCPKCRSHDIQLTGHCAAKLDERPRFCCGGCKTTWTAGSTGAPYLAFAARRPADGTTATADGRFLDWDDENRPEGATTATCPNCGWRGFAGADVLGKTRCLRCRSRRLVAPPALPPTATPARPAQNTAAPARTGSQ